MSCHVMSYRIESYRIVLPHLQVATTSRARRGKKQGMESSPDAGTINWDTLRYQSGFGNSFASEAKPGALPEVRLGLRLFAWK